MTSPTPTLANGIPITICSTQQTQRRTKSQDAQALSARKATPQQDTIPRFGSWTMKHTSIRTARLTISTSTTLSWTTTTQLMMVVSRALSTSTQKSTTNNVSPTWLDSLARQLKTPILRFLSVMIANITARWRWTQWESTLASP